MGDIKYQNFEKKRQEKIGYIHTERNKIIQYAERKLGFTFTTHTDDGGSPSSQRPSKDKGSALLEAEEKRMEALKRRQEKELQKTIEKEQNTVKIQMRIQKAEEDEAKKQKALAKKIIDQKKAEEKKRLQAVQDAKQLDYEEEQMRKQLAKKEAEIADKLAKQQAQQEKLIKQEAIQRDKERKLKMEEYKKKTASILKAQEDAGIENKNKMLEREKKIMDQLEAKRELKRIEVQASREKAAVRIEEALHKHHEMHESKKVAFDERQAKAQVMAKEKALLERERLKKQADDRDRRNAVRMNRLIDAFNTREEKKSDTIKRRYEKDTNFDTIATQRQEKIDMLKFNTSLKLADKAENVERVKRINEFKRLQTLQRIQSLDSRYGEIEYNKAKLAKKQAEAAKNNLIRKHEISDSMDRMKMSNDFSILDKLFTKKDNSKKDKDDEDPDKDPRLAQTM